MHNQISRYNYKDGGWPTLIGTRLITEYLIKHRKRQKLSLLDAHLMDKMHLQAV